MPDPHKTPFEVFRGRSRSQSERSLRLSHPSADRPAAESPAPERRAASASSGGSRSNWMSQPLRLRITPAVLLLAGLGVFVLIIIAYEIGHSGSTSTQRQTDARSTQRLAEARRQPINGLLQRTGETVAPGSSTAANPDDSATDPAPVVSPDGAATSTSANGDPRIPGYNYFCLATMPPKYRSEAERAVSFLKRNRVDARVFSVNNRWLQVVALRGFASPSSPQAKEYESLLRSLGTAWKAEQDGWSDWHDLYAIKYTP